MFPETQTRNTTEKGSYEKPYANDYTASSTVRQVFNDDFIHDFDEFSWVERVHDDLKRAEKRKAKQDRAERIRDAGTLERGLYTDTENYPRSIDAARHRVDEYPDVPPEATRIWSRLLQQRARRKFRKDGWQKNFSLFKYPYFYKLKLEDLEIKKLAAKEIAKARVQRPNLNLDDPLEIKLNAALLKLILLDNLKFGVCAIKLEANLKSIHYHVIAERQALAPHLKRLEAKQQGPCVPVYDEVGLLGYLLKGTFTVKSYSEDNPNETILKLAADIEAERRYLAFTGKSRGPNMLQFYKAKRLQ